MELLLEIIGLPRSTFYYQLTPQSAEDKYAGLKQHIRTVYRQHKGHYGYRRITTAISQTGTLANHKTISRLMNMMGLKAVIRQRKYRSFKGEAGTAAPNILNRCFKAQRPNEKWVTDVTEFNVASGKLYLSPIMDLFNEEIVSYRIQSRPTFDLVGMMLESAFKTLRGSDKPILHSDQDLQYQLGVYQQRLKDKGQVQSMSRKGNRLDNAAMESFFGTLKSECFYTRKYASVAELESALHKYIRYYNHDRIKLKLKELSPVEYRVQSLKTA